MTPEEILSVTQKALWATIITVSDKGLPYAIEATPFETQTHTCFMINPKGGTAKNLPANGNVLLKYTLAASDCSLWIGVSCFGMGAFVHEPGEIIQGWSLLGQKLGIDYSAQGEKFSKTPERSPLLAVKITSQSGRCSARPGEPLPII
jgi:hypothetical protein